MVGHYAVPSGSGRRFVSWPLTEPQQESIRNARRHQRGSRAVATVDAAKGGDGR
jgi:hypothetical protein